MRVRLFLAALTATGILAGAALASAAPLTPLDQVSLGAAPAFAPAPAREVFDAARYNSLSTVFADTDRAAFDLSDTLHLTIAQARFDPPRDLVAFNNDAWSPIADTSLALAKPQLRETSASLDWSFTDWGGLGLTATDDLEPVGLLGHANLGALAPADFAHTSSVALSAHVSLGDGWVTTVSYGMGISQLNLKADAPIATNTLHSRAVGFAVAKHGLFGDADSLGLSVTQPVQQLEGRVDLSSVSLTASGGDSGYSLLGDRSLLPGSTPETDVELGYVTTFFGGALALQANAGYQMNLVGQSGVNSVSVLSRAKINF